MGLCFSVESVLLSIVFLKLVMYSANEVDLM